MLDATDIDAECVRYCPNDYVMEKINNASTCVKVEQKGKFTIFLLAIIWCRTSNIFRKGFFGSVKTTLKS